MAGEHAEQADGLGSGTLGDKAETHDAPAWLPAVESTSGADEWRSLWILDVASGLAPRVSPEGLNTWEGDWLGPDAVVAVVSDTPPEDAWYGARVVRIDLDSGAVTTLHEPEWQVQFATGSPDGRSAAVIESVASDRYYTMGEVILVAADGSGSRTLATGETDIGAVRWLDDDRLVALGIAGMQSVTGILDIDGAWRETWRGDVIVGGQYLQVSPVGGDGAVVLSLNGAETADRVSVIQNGAERVLLSLEHPGHAPCGAARASQEVVSWTGRDGWRIEGLLRLPHGEPPYATILWVHGGPVGATGQSFPGVEMAMFLEAGYAILTPNPRGSTGRGRAFAEAVVGDMGGEDSFDLLAGVEHLVAAGITDPARIAVAGFSYGGYMAAHLPTLTDRFAAAIVSSPLTDMLSSYYGSSLTVFVRDYVGGHPATDTERYLARSPVFAGERLRTPSLITSGGRDRATPAGQAVELFRALREQGVDAELVIYPQEGHGVSDLAARADWSARSIAWLERFMPAARPG
jgi:dipeptidyl aminopeptidase/acylaminoacyl peptidase